MTDTGELLELARGVAAEAAALLLEGRDSADLDLQTKSSPTDVVTAMDRRAERQIVDALLAARPHDGVLGEEGTQRAGTSGVRWVIDPVDGTVNYLYRLPGWAVSLAAEQDGEVVVGVVDQPATATVYWAVRGGGAWRSRHGGPPQRLTGPAPTTLDQALVATGFGYTVGRRTVQAEVVRRVLPHVRDIRRFGAASLDLCQTAAGLTDAYYERGLCPWDLAAGGLIAREAGVAVGGLGGAAAGEELVVAAAPELFAALHDLLDATGLATRDDLPG